MTAHSPHAWYGRMWEYWLSENCVMGLGLMDMLWTNLDCLCHVGINLSSSGNTVRACRIPRTASYTRYWLVLRWIPSNIPSIHLIPSLAPPPSRDLPLNRSRSPIKGSLSVWSDPLILLYAVRPSRPTTPVRRTKAACSTNHAINGWVTGTC